MRRSERLLFTSILLAGALLRLWGLTFGIPYPEARPDETTIVITATGLLFAGLNPHFFHWPSLEFYLVSALYRIGWEVGHLLGWYRLKFDMYKAASVHAAPFLIVPRAFGVLAGVATIWLVFKLMDRLCNRLTAITAAFFVAIAFLHVRDSHFGVPDVPMTALAVAALLAWTSAIEDPARVGRWALAGALSGLAASTKYNGGLVLIPALASGSIAWMQREPTVRRHIFRGMVALTGTALLAFLCGTPYAILDRTHFFEGLRFDFTHLMEGHQIVLSRGWLYHLKFSLWYGLGAPLLIAGLAGMVLLSVTSWKKAVVICTFPILYYLTVGRGYTVFVRYITPVVPFLCMTAAFLLVRSVQRFVRPQSAPPVVALVAIVLALPSIARDLAFDVLMNRTDTRVLAQDWVASHVRHQDWIGQIPPVLIYPDFGIAKPANLATFDINRKAFVTSNGETVSPDWIMVPTSPMYGYTVGAQELGAIANPDYVRETTIPAAHGAEMPAWFDQQDLFFVPFTNFSMRDRPGPEIQIFRRRR